ncbi:MAG: deoxyribodipyrimidine photo-lyase [Proteobacteria bacterium]|nr:deoxyribodipyrimidine photo-lyase [Pseudomonadota bacterium]
MSKTPITIFWFRRDLRLQDNAALFHALKASAPVLPIFIFDRDILDGLKNKKDARVLFIHQEVSRLKNELEKIGSSLQVFYGKPQEIYRHILEQYQVKALYANRDYEPYAIKRDKEIYQFLKSQNIDFKGFKDQVIFEKSEIVKDDKKPYTVFTPYSKKWKAKAAADDFYFKSYFCEKYFKNFLRCDPFPTLSLADIGFIDFEFEFPSREIDLQIIKKYSEQRDFPAIVGTSRLSLHLRFGTISIRKLAAIAAAKNEKWLNELIWRDFYQMIFYHFPHSANQAFKPQYDKINWRNDEQEFQKWCVGKTGYAIVDAGMRELNQTGFMHNRVRMIVASFLTKHLLIDWRWGEKYFAEKLLDYDAASNVGGWQWAAGSGCDAAPYFRIFNPESQTEKFDADLKYIKKWLPEFESENYPKPIVDHKLARKRCLETFKAALNR